MINFWVTDPICLQRKLTFSDLSRNISSFVPSTLEYYPLTVEFIQMYDFQSFCCDPWPRSYCHSPEHFQYTKMCVIAQSLIVIMYLFFYQLSAHNLLCNLNPVLCLVKACDLCIKLYIDKRIKNYQNLSVTYVQVDHSLNYNMSVLKRKWAKRTYPPSYFAL